MSEPRGATTRPVLAWLAAPGAAAGAAAGAAVVVVLVVIVAVGAGPALALGGQDPGAAVRVAEPVLRLIAQAAGTVCVGALVFALGFTVPDERGRLSARGWAAVRAAGGWAAVWALVALAMTWFTLAAAVGAADAPARLLATSSPGDVWAVLAAGEEPVAWLVSAVLAVAVAVGCRLVLVWVPAAGLLVLAGAALLPPAATGHASSQAGHDLALPALFAHVLAAAVWLGTLVAVVRPGWRRGPGVASPEVVARRYERCAAACWGMIVASGLVDAGVLLGRPEALLTTPYGWLLVVIVVVTVVLGVLGWRWRRRCLERGNRLHLALGELVLLGVTGGLSVAATVLVPPAWQQPVTAWQTLLGYDLDGPPTVLRLLLDGRVDVAFLPAAVLGAVLYVRAVRRLRAAGERWATGRTVAWLGGCAVVAIATSSGIGRYGAAMISLHITTHMLLSMLAPTLLVLGAPITLLRRARPPREDGEPSGARDVVDLVATSGVGRAAARPLPVLALFSAAPFVLYLTPLFDAAVRYRWAEMLIDAAVLGLGLAFARVTVGTGPGPPAWARVALLLAAMPFGAVFAAILATTSRVVGDGPAGSNMYSSLDLPWTRGDLLGEQHVAAGVALALGEIFLLFALAAVLARWDRRHRRDGSDPASAAEHAAEVRASARTEGPPRSGSWARSGAGAGCWSRRAATTRPSRPRRSAG